MLKPKKIKKIIVPMGEYWPKMSELFSFISLLSFQELICKQKKEEMGGKPLVPNLTVSS